VIGDIQIGPAVVIVVAPNRTEPVAMPGIIHPGLLGDFLERAVAPVVIKQVAFSFHAPGAALDKNLLVAAELFVAAEGRELIHVQLDVTRDKQINVTVAVVVGPGRAGHEAAAAQDRKSTRLNSSHRTISYAVF